MVEVYRSNTQKREGFGFSSVAAAVVLFIAVVIYFSSYFAYFSFPSSAVKASVGLFSAVFWLALWLLLNQTVFRETFKRFVGVIKTSLGATVFAAYVCAHLFLYGFVLEEILAASLNIGSTIAPPLFFVTTNLVTPPTLLNSIFTLSFSPSVALTLGPVLGAELSVYNFFMATLIGVLITANMAQVKQTKKLCSGTLKAKTYVGMPLLGIFLGASCCMSPPILLALVLPSSTLAAALSKSIATTYITYYFFPILAVLLLYFSIKTTGRMLESLGAR